ncbi:hypothetical protein ACFQS1_32650 [Paractinoplanes rhizophilus]|jgi:hypothetical protein|uniref:Uncharacterized protein n=1 Tax=Paractinoplanes rhizophilus TaxID=1416877 RepID=A0ABW2I1J8_9ACTN|nr:hypothetical protein [Actinoplanes sp.]
MSMGRSPDRADALIDRVGEREALAELLDAVRGGQSRAPAERARPMPPA